MTTGPGPRASWTRARRCPKRAVREVKEEIGLDITLGIPLPTIHYQVNAGLKEVHYWAARVDGCQAHGRTARKSMTCCGAHRRKRGRCWPTLRQGTAGGPDGGARPPGPGDLAAADRPPCQGQAALLLVPAEGDRPLAATGLRQALAVQRLLMAWQSVPCRDQPLAALRRHHVPLRQGHRGQGQNL